MCRADNLTTFLCGLFSNLGDSSFSDPQGLSRPVMGLPYLYNILVDNTKLSSSDFCYLVSVVAEDGGDSTDVNVRIQKARG